MKLDTTNAPTTPKTTNSSFVNPHTGFVVRHNMQITFSKFSALTNDPEQESRHIVHHELIDPNRVTKATINSINMLLEADCVEIDEPLFAHVSQQIVGERNTEFGETSVFSIAPKTKH